MACVLQQVIIKSLKRFAITGLGYPLKEAERLSEYTRGLEVNKSEFKPHVHHIPTRGPKSGSFSTFHFTLFKVEWKYTPLRVVVEINALSKVQSSFSSSILKL